MHGTVRVAVPPLAEGVAALLLVHRLRLPLSAWEAPYEGNRELLLA